MSRHGAKTFNADHESEFRRHLRNVYNAAQDIAFSFRSDPSAYVPCETFSAAHSEFLRTLLEKDDDLFERRRLITAKHQFLNDFLAWVDTLLPATSALVEAELARADAPELKALLQELAFDPASITDYGQAEQKAEALESVFDRLPGAPALRDASLRQIACVRARQAAQSLAGFVRDLPEALDAKARELERTKAIVAEKQKEIPERRAELQKSQNEERELDRQIAQIRQEITRKHEAVRQEEQRHTEKLRDLNEQLREERMRNVRRVAALEELSRIQGENDE
jgi:DNA repair exonuclease SbcCD ATPase subunit